MSIESMSKQRLPSPPASVEGEYYPGIGQILQHNAEVPQISGHNVQDGGGYAHSGQSTAYGSPNGNHWMVDQYADDQLQDPYQHQEVGLGIGYDWYSSPTELHNQNGPYHTNSVSAYLDQRFTAGSPPTPSASDMSAGEHMTTRSGRPLAPSGSIRAQKLAAQDRSRTTVAAKVKKTSKQNKSERPKVPKLDAPLSELTKNYDQVPVKNMEEWVNRSAEVRNKEVEKRNGYVTRPMNSFMLYRSAYAERTKIWCLQNNHQVVSSVSGESWPMEPPHIREKFNEYARIERDNHQKAHPGYKFSPSKAQNSSRKRKGTNEKTDDDDASDQHDLDFDWRPAGERRPRVKSTKRLGREAGYPVNSTLYNEVGYGIQSTVSELNRSSYQVTNPGKPLPTAMSDHDMYGQYYQTETYQRFNDPNIQDVLIRRTDGPGMLVGAAPPVIGLPGAHHYELLNHDPQGLVQNMGDSQVDPLLRFDAEYLQQSGSFISEQQFKDFNDDMLFGVTPQLYEQISPGENFQAEQNPWQYTEQPNREADEDFARWMEENNDR
ncbi:hypothetical protein MMC17_003602 [Xylographa soralifera]|nr:hypothetical protein [Xylographa soralifera]